MLSADSGSPFRLGQRSSNGQRWGASAVEFAVIAPALFVFILGIIEIGRALMVVQQLNNVAQLACRQAVVYRGDNPTYSSTDVKTLVTTTLSAQGITGVTTTVYVNGGVADLTTSNSNDKITVAVSVPVSNISWVPGSGYLKGSLTGQCTLDHE